ncbi:WhiB family transcriptional regulator [Micromonospora rubida]
MSLRLIANAAVPAWHDRANCQGTDTDEFYPEKGGSTLTAKRICARCEVQTECLESAVATREPYGIWGGMSQNERRALGHKATQAGVAA